MGVGTLKFLNFFPWTKESLSRMIDIGSLVLYNIKQNFEEPL